MNTCQKCLRDTVKMKLYSETVPTYPIGTEVFPGNTVSSESDCEFWAHEALNVFRAATQYDPKSDCDLLRVQCAGGSYEMKFARPRKELPPEVADE